MKSTNPLIRFPIINKQIFLDLFQRKPWMETICWIPQQSIFSTSPFHNLIGNLPFRNWTISLTFIGDNCISKRHKKYVNSFVVWKQISFHTDSEWVLHHANSLRVANKTCFSKFEIWNSKFEIITLFPIILKAGRRKLFAKTIDRISWIFGKSDQWF